MRNFFRTAVSSRPIFNTPASLFSSLSLSVNKQLVPSPRNLLPDIDWILAGSQTGAALKGRNRHKFYSSKGLCDDDDERGPFKCKIDKQKGGDRTMVCEKREGKDKKKAKSACKKEPKKSPCATKQEKRQETSVCKKEPTKSPCATKQDDRQEPSVCEKEPTKSLCPTQQEKQQEKSVCDGSETETETSQVYDVANPRKCWNFDFKCPSSTEECPPPVEEECPPPVEEECPPHVEEECAQEEKKPCKTKKEQIKQFVPCKHEDIKSAIRPRKSKHVCDDIKKDKSSPDASMAKKKPEKKQQKDVVGGSNGFFRSICELLFAKKKKVSQKTQSAPQLTIPAAAKSTTKCGKAKEKVELKVKIKENKEEPKQKNPASVCAKKCKEKSKQKSSASVCAKKSKERPKQKDSASVCAKKSKEKPKQKGSASVCAKKSKEKPKQKESASVCPKESEEEPKVSGAECAKKMVEYAQKPPACGRSDAKETKKVQEKPKQKESASVCPKEETEPAKKPPACADAKKTKKVEEEEECDD